MIGGDTLVYDLGFNNTQNNAVTAEYICSKLEKLSNSEDGLSLSFMEKYKDEAIRLNKEFINLEYITTLREKSYGVNLDIWKYRR